MNIKIRKNSSIIEKNCNYTAESHRHIKHIENLYCRCKLTKIIRTYRLEIFLILVIIFNLIENTLGNPVFVDNPSIAQFQSGRNIRHLPCIVRKSGLSGTCMFAIDCIKQNGTHLGTCIDRFYFGSCCQMKEDIPYYAHDINDNSIDQNTISHFAHESSTSLIPQTNALFKPTTESVLISSSSSSSDSLLKNKLTTQLPHVSISTSIPMQNRETPIKPQQIDIDQITTYKPVIKHETSGNLSTTILSSSTSTPSTLTTSGDLLPATLSKTNSTSTSVSLDSKLSETSSITKIPSSVVISDSLSFESFSSQPIPSNSTIVQTSSSPSQPSTQSLSPLPLEVTTPNPDQLKPLQTSTNPVLTTTRSTEKPYRTTTEEESKFSTFQVVETTTPTVPSVSQSTSSSSLSPSSSLSQFSSSPLIPSFSSSSSSSFPSSSSSRLPQTTYKPSSKQPITTINVTNKPISSRRPTTQRTKATRRPIISTKPTVSPTAFSSTTRKPSISKTTTVRFKPQPSTSTRRTTTIPKRPLTKRPTTITTIRPKPITKRPTTISTSTIVTTLPKIVPTILKNTTFSTQIHNFTTQVPPELLALITTTTTTKSTTTQLPLVPAATKAPRPKPKPTANIVKVPPSIISDKVSESISTVAPPSAPTNKPFLITGKPLTTKPIPISLPTEPTPTATSSTLRPILLNTSSNKPVITELPTITESTTMKPSGLVTWTKIDGPSINNTDKNNDWVPRPPPDWVLLPTIKPDSEINKTLETTGSLPPKTNVSTTQGLSNNSELPLTTPQNIVTLTTPPPETSSQFIHLVNQSSTEGLLSSLSTENSINNLNGSTTQGTTIDMNSSDGSTISTTTPIPSLEGLDYKQICGKRMFPEPRIVGGANAAFGRWPWQISLRQWRTSTYLHKCGAALLNENWAITAAHCVDNVPPSDLLLRLGEYDLAEEEEPYSYQERRVQIVASHPQFDPRTFEYDLALLRFYEPVAFQPNIIPVCVPDNDYDFLERTAYVTGWGRLYEDGPLPSVLQEVSVPVINNTICETMYRAAGYIEHIPHIFICAGWKKGGYDSCEGDSGGPMVLQRDDKRFVLGGVISWGIGCAEPNQPGVYTRISEFRDWINQILQF